MLDARALATGAVDGWLLRCTPANLPTAVVPWKHLRGQHRAPVWGAVALRLSESSTLKALAALQAMGREQVPSAREAQQQLRAISAWVGGAPEPRGWDAFIQWMYGAAEQAQSVADPTPELIVASDRVALTADALRQMAGAAGREIAENPWPRLDEQPDDAASYAARAVELLALAHALASPSLANSSLSPKREPGWLVPVVPDDAQARIDRAQFLAFWWHIVQCLDHGA